jgi:acid phosphatase type 7
MGTIRQPGSATLLRAALAAASLLALLGTIPADAAAQQGQLIAAAGDISCTPPNPEYNNGIGISSECQQLATSDLLNLHEWAAVLPLGDLTYDDGAALEGFESSYEPTWGRWRLASHPVIGNHEYDDRLGADGYWDYWNGFGNGQGRAGTRRRGWYAYNVGSWRLIALNSNCDRVRCNWDSAQVRFLRHELERHSEQCVLAYFHHPRFSSGVYEERVPLAGIWKALFRGGADVALNGHDHLYERFAPQTPGGLLNKQRGVTQFTVGTGGYFLFPLGDPAPNSRFRQNLSFGILAMRLYPDRYAWNFMAVPDGHSLDSGSRRCHRELPKPKHHHHKGHAARAAALSRDG